MSATTILVNAFTTALELSSSEVNETLEYNNHQQWDSTAHMILIAQLENDFDIMLDIDDIIDMSSFKKAKEILLKYDDSLSF
jgi:acyl carrier protein